MIHIFQAPHPLRPDSLLIVPQNLSLRNPGVKRKKSQSGFVPPLSIIFNRIFPFHMEDLKNRSIPEIVDYLHSVEGNKKYLSNPPKSTWDNAIKFESKGHRIKGQALSFILLNK